MSMLLLVSTLAVPMHADATPTLVIDMDSRQVLHEEDAGVAWYPASTTKVMTALVTFEAIRSGQISLSSPVVMTRRATRQAFLESGLVAGETMSLEDALYAMLTASANDVAMAVGEAVGPGDEAFVAKMNEAARRLGMTGTHFANPNGLFDRNNYTTARDLALLGLAVEQQFPEFARFFQASAVSIKGKEIKSNNLLLTRYRGTTGMKTGFICASGRNYVGTATRNNRRVMVVMFGATTERERNERAAQFFTDAFANRLPPVAASVEAVVNRPEVKPEDMRMRLCSNEAAKYEAGREALYPMGLPGQPSYLDAEVPGVVRTITTWQSKIEADVPVPARRPQETDRPKN